MIEIIEHQINVANNEACSYFLKDLADSNEAASLRIMESSHVIVNVHHDDDENNDGETNRMTWFPNLSLPALPSTKEQCCCACIARGSQKVVTARGGEVVVVGDKDRPFTNNDNDASSHWIDVDICVLRLPVVQTDLLITLSTPQQQQKQLRRQQQKQNDEIQSDAGVGSAELYSPLFRQVLNTFHIKDWSLFAS